MMHQTSIYGSQVHYWVYNPKFTRTIVMIHGFRGNHIGLERIIAGLGAFRVIVPDLPGHGESTPMVGRKHDVVGLSDFVLEFITKLGLDQPILLGHSFGSIVAAHFAAHHGDLISELILINPIAISPRRGRNLPITKMVEAYYWLGIHLPESAGKLVIGSKTFSRLMSLSLAKSWNLHTRRMIHAHHLNDLTFEQHRQVIGQSFADSITKTASDHAGQIHNRTLLIAGSRDAIAPPAAQKRLLSDFADAQLIVIPKVGHLIHLETPASASIAINAFLS